MNSSFTLKYKVLEKIGEGAFSEVLKCQNRITEELFAAKKLKKCYRNRQEVYECPELVAMRKISRHPNILYIIETHYEQLFGRVTLILELLDMSLYDYIKVRKSPVPELKAKNYLYQIAKGIYHLHKNGLFHRDIKPENILMKISNSSSRLKGEIIKLGDLGSIRGIYSKPPYTEYISTRWYRPPECLLTSGFYGSKMDIWATGCVFFEILKLKPLFPGSDEIDQIHKIHQIIGSPTSYTLKKFRQHKSRNCDFSFPTIKGTGFKCLLPNLSCEACDILTHMLIYDPDYRFNIRQVLEHQYFKEKRIEWTKRSVPSIPRLKVSSNPNISCSYNSVQISQDFSKNFSDKDTKGLLSEAHSEIISNFLNKKSNLLKSRSDSVNLKHFSKNSSTEDIRAKVFTHQKNLNVSTWLHLKNKTRNDNVGLSDRLATKKSSDNKNSYLKSNYIKNKSYSIGKFPVGEDSHFYVQNKIKQPLPKKLSESGLLANKSINFDEKKKFSKISVFSRQIPNTMMK